MIRQAPIDDFTTYDIIKMFEACEDVAEITAMKKHLDPLITSLRMSRDKFLQKGSVLVVNTYNQCRNDLARKEYEVKRNGR